MPEYTFNQEVNLLVADETDIGYKVIINNLHWGLVYYNEVFRRLEKGEEIKGYIKEVREDEKIDISLVPLGYQKIEGLAGTILESLKSQEDLSLYTTKVTRKSFNHFSNAARKASNKRSVPFTNNILSRWKTAA